MIKSAVSAAWFVVREEISFRDVLHGCGPEGARTATDNQILGV